MTLKHPTACARSFACFHKIVQMQVGDASDDEAEDHQLDDARQLSDTSQREAGIRAIIDEYMQQQQQQQHN